jgi:hypothetical protein
MTQHFFQKWRRPKGLFFNLEPPSKENAGWLNPADNVFLHKVLYAARVEREKYSGNNLRIEVVISRKMKFSRSSFFPKWISGWEVVYSQGDTGESDVFIRVPDDVLHLMKN